MMMLKIQPWGKPKKNLQSRRLMGIIMDVNNLSGEEREREREWVGER
ncbi:hypothetical protein Hanom_Chr07g00672561 [Helianthus anomalus]